MNATSKPKLVVDCSTRPQLAVRLAQPVKVFDTELHPGEAYGFTEMSAVSIVVHGKGSPHIAGQEAKERWAELLSPFAEHLTAEMRELLGIALPAEPHPPIADAPAVETPDATARLLSASHPEFSADAPPLEPAPTPDMRPTKRRR